MPKIQPLPWQKAVFIIKNNLKTARMSRERYFELLGEI